MRRSWGRAPSPEPSLYQGRRSGQPSAPRPAHPAGTGDSPAAATAYRGEDAGDGGPGRQVSGQHRLDGLLERNPAGPHRGLRRLPLRLPRPVRAGREEDLAALVGEPRRGVQREEVLPVRRADPRLLPQFPLGGRPGRFALLVAQAGGDLPLGGARRGAPLPESSTRPESSSATTATDPGWCATSKSLRSPPGSRSVSRRTVNNGPSNCGAEVTVSKPSGGVVLLCSVVLTNPAYPLRRGYAAARPPPPARPSSCRPGATTGGRRSDVVEERKL